jgi:putative transposase
MPKSYTQLLYHFVFATKDRRPFLEPSIGERLHPYLGGIIREQGGSAIGINGAGDHVHVFARLRQDRSVADILRALKANSSAWLHRTFPALADFAWQEGYGAFTVSASQKPRVKTYVEHQEEHHRKRSFREEFVELLQKHGIEYDERYLWV